MSKVLIVHPDFSRLGGIENYYRKIYPHLKIAFESLGNSKRAGESGLRARIMRIINDYYLYWKKLADPNIDIVHLNPSLAAKMFYRESIYLFIARLRHKKTVVFFHGWDTEFQRKIDRTRGLIFRLLYGRADTFIVLASSFVNKIRQWGVTRPIYREVIVIEDEVIQRIDIDSLLHERLNSANWLLLFPARIMRTKGILTTIRVCALVQKHHPDFSLIVAGDGEHMQEAKDLVHELGVNNVGFVGIVSGEDKYNIFRQAHILCFPTEHSEGFPNTIVEAMAFGMPVLTRPVGGIPDFFVNGEHGFLSDSTQPEVYSDYINDLVNDRERYERIARSNHKYARSSLQASKAAARIENIYRSLRGQ